MKGIDSDRELERQNSDETAEIVWRQNKKIKRWGIDKSGIK